MPNSNIISDLSTMIVECEDRVNEIWFGRTKFSTKHEDKLRSKIHTIHLIEEALFVQLWDAYYDFPDEVEKISKKLYCDGQFHFRVRKNDNLRYAYVCDC